MKDRIDCAKMIETFDNRYNIYLYPKNGNIKVSCSETIVDQKEMDFSDLTKKMDWHYKRLSIRLTGNCNMACQYCFTNFHSMKRVICPDYYKRAIEDFVMQLDKSDVAGIIITGGEATLYKNIIVDIITFASAICTKREIEVKFMLYTNFMLIDSDFMEAIAKYNISIALSIDGTCEKHDKNRLNPANVSSYKQILKNLLLAKKFPSVTLEARSVIQANENDIVEVINNNLELGFERMHLMPVYGFQNEQYSGSIEAWEQALRVYEKIIVSGYRIEIEPFYSLYRKIRFPHTFFTSFFPCNAGRENICLGDDGNYYLCNHFVGSEKIGDYEAGLPQYKQVDDFINRLTEKSICGQCDYLRLCGGACYHKFFLGKAPENIENCKNWIKIIKMVIRSYVRLSLTNPEALDMLCDKNKGAKSLMQEEIIDNIQTQINELDRQGVK